MASAAEIRVIIEESRNKLRKDLTNDIMTKVEIMIESVVDKKLAAQEEKIMHEIRKLHERTVALEPGSGTVAMVEDAGGVSKASSDFLALPSTKAAEENKSKKRTLMAEKMTRVEKAELIAKWKPSFRSPDLPRDDLDMPTWVVVGGANKGGVLVRYDQGLHSRPYCKGLKTGTLIEELELIGSRLHYKRLCGDGPDYGWVSLEHNGVTLMEPYATDDSDTN
mmetsp:Transcript_3272/g.3637  ORF Transcript_3272/g.3637 Transcript_3272/m.3637 type:complete len:222 (+) Transcript_3272:64-729(+)